MTHPMKPAVHPESKSPQSADVDRSRFPLGIAYGYTRCGKSRSIDHVLRDLQDPSQRETSPDPDERRAARDGGE